MLAFHTNAANGAVVDDKSMVQWLATSVLSLPSNRHCHMFLDAATVLLAQPLQHLRCTWIAMVQADDQLKFSDAAACSVDAILAKLVSSSLISITNSRYEPVGMAGMHCELHVHQQSDACSTGSHALLAAVLPNEPNRRRQTAVRC